MKSTLLGHSRDDVVPATCHTWQASTAGNPVPVPLFRIINMRSLPLPACAIPSGRQKRRKISVSLIYCDHEDLGGDLRLVLGRSKCAMGDAFFGRARLTGE